MSNHKKILITGGAGFVGSSLAIKLKIQYPKNHIICLDNLKRRGSELNIDRLKHYGIEFLHGDIRNKEDIESIRDINLILECSAEPSVLAGYNSPEYLINTNLLGTINCLELARKRKSDFIFLSTSRVYPFKTINSLNFTVAKTRFELKNKQDIIGVSAKGYTENFPLQGSRSLYGATKLASELLIQEYQEMYNIRAVINRCGVITGPWQFGKIDQGFVVLWIAKHFWKQKLSYIGFGGEGKQVRDIVHIDDLYNLINIQLKNIGKFNGEIFNVGGGKNISVSLNELTSICEKITGNKIKISKIQDNRNADIRIYLTDNTKVTKLTGWQPKISITNIIEGIHNWIKNNEKQLIKVLK
ncbi:MAG: NAD-dependent epimerase/dehydratase family protein [Candidatus Firestonebacteria bacterium]